MPSKNLLRSSMLNKRKTQDTERVPCVSLVAEMGFVCPVCFCVKLSSGLSAILRSNTQNDAVCCRCNGKHRPRRARRLALVRSGHRA